MPQIEVRFNDQKIYIRGLFGMEILKEFLIATGGGAAALVVALTVFREMFLKAYVKAIDMFFDKAIEKYRNKLNRSTTAYELLLNKELKCYSKLDVYIAKLVPLVQDLTYYANDNSHGERQPEEFRECLLSFIKIVPEIKNLNVLYQPYIPSEVFTSVAALISSMQSGFDFWKDTAEILFSKDSDIVDISKAKDISDTVLFCICKVEQNIKERLTQLSNI